VVNVRCLLSSDVVVLWDSCSSETCVIVIDYSKNYTCKQSRAVQSAHFRASNSQISLHTGVAYMHNVMMSFCSKLAAI